MKNILFAAIVFIAALGLAPNAQAQSSRLYFAGYMGLNVVNGQQFHETISGTRGDIKYNNGFSFAGALGLRINHQWRAEAELSLRRTDMSKISFNGGGGTFNLGGSLNTYLLMLNGYYDFDLGWDKLTPFLSGGLGLVWHDAQIDDKSGMAVDATDEDFGFAWQLGGGLKYRVNEDMAFTGSYRYLGATDADFDTYETQYDSHEFRVGIEYDIPVSTN